MNWVLILWIASLVLLALAVVFAPDEPNEDDVEWYG